MFIEYQFIPINILDDYRKGELKMKCSKCNTILKETNNEIGLCDNCQKKYNKNPQEVLMTLGIIKIIIGITSFVIFILLSMSVFKNTVFVPILLILSVLFLFYGLLTGLKQYFDFR